MKNGILNEDVYKCEPVYGHTNVASRKLIAGKGERVSILSETDDGYFCMNTFSPVIFFVWESGIADIVEL
jgi:hypothetical protein